MGTRKYSQPSSPPWLLTSTARQGSRGCDSPPDRHAVSAGLGVALEASWASRIRLCQRGKRGRSASASPCPRARPKRDCPGLALTGQVA